MNSVALQASSPSSALSAEVDLVRQASRGEAEAFTELYRRHSSVAWRLAQAVAPDRDGATAAFREGFVRAVRSNRGLRRPGATFRDHVLASVYRAAIDQSYDRSTPAPAQRRGATPEAALTDAAFRSLPERWRAALWLSEAENFDAERLAAVVGVSAAVAEQLVSRGRRGLANRFAQARHEPPAHLGEALRPLAMAMPGDLAAATSSRWSVAGADHLPAFAPVTAWMEERSVRPMSVAVGALIGLGLIGLGVVDSGPALRSQLNAAGPAAVNGAIPVHTCLGLACPGPAGSAATSLAGFSIGNGSDITAAAATGTGTGTGTGTFTTTGTGGAGGSALSYGTSPAATTGTTGGGGTTGGTTAGSGGSGSSTGGGTGSNHNPPGGSTPPSSGSTTLISVPGILSVGVGCSSGGVGVTVNSTTVGCGTTLTTTTPTSTPPATTNPLSGVTSTVTTLVPAVGTVVGGVSSVVGGATSVITGTNTTPGSVSPTSTTTTTVPGLVQTVTGTAGSLTSGL
jgi:DNA-directed RNA polymerase specialized sigma24 family protein